MSTTLNVKSPINYFRWFIEECKIALSESKKIKPLKLLASERDIHTGEIFFKVQPYGKNMCLTYTVKQLQGEEILENFSSCDVERIMKAARNDTKEMLEPDDADCSMDGIVFDNETKRRLYRLRYRNKEVSFSKQMSASELNEARETLFKLDKTSIREVSFQAGRESILLEVKHFKNHSSAKTLP